MRKDKISEKVEEREKGVYATASNSFNMQGLRKEGSNAHRTVQHVRMKIVIAAKNYAGGGKRKESVSWKRPKKN